MAARTRKERIDDITRSRISTTQLCNRLKKHGLGKIELSQTQVRAIEILLRKVLPDLAAVEHTGNVEQSYIVRMPAPIADLDTWRAINDGHVQRDPNSTPASPVAVPVAEGTKH